MLDLGVDPDLWPVVAVAVVLIAAGVAWRYRALVRRGSSLPPGVGGVRLVGMTGTMTRAHRPGAEPAGEVLVLGETWRVVHEDVPLPEGIDVLVTEVEGTRLRVRPVEASRPDHDPTEGHP